MASGSALRLLLKHARETVDECLPSNVSREDLNNHTLDGKLNEVLFAVSSAGHGSSKSIDLSWEDKADIWHVVCKLWVGTAHCHVFPSHKTPKNQNVPNQRQTTHALRRPIRLKSYTLDCNGSGSSSDVDAMQNSCVDTFSPSSQCPRWMVTLRQHARYSI